MSADHDQDGFIALIVGLILIVLIVVTFVFLRVIQA